MLTELSEQKMVFIPFINLCCCFLSSSRVLNDLWLSSMSCLTNPSWIFPGKVDSCNDVHQARKGEATHWNTRPPDVISVRQPGTHPRFDTGADPRVLFVHNSRKGSVVLLVGECVLLCSQLCWYLPWKMPSPTNWYLGKGECCDLGSTSLCPCMNQISIGVEAQSASQ